MVSIISRSPQATFDLGREFASRLRAGDVVALTGDLGAGKTHFVKGLAAGLGVSADVTSPTFTLIHEYRGGRVPLYHIDCYRLDAMDDLLTIGIDEYLRSDGVTAIEWADKFAELLPPDARWIRFQVLENDAREIQAAELQ